MGRDPNTPLDGLREGPVGVVLAGGHSRRMGRDKATLPWGGGSLGSHALERLAAVCQDVVVADRGRNLLPGTRSVADGSGRGPVAGILGAAALFPGRCLLVLACDLPAVPVALLREMAVLDRAADLVIPCPLPGPEPLVAVYGPAALRVLADRASAGDFALYPLLREPALRVHRLEEDSLAAFGDPVLLFRNLNTEEDWRAWGGQPGRR